MSYYRTCTSRAREAATPAEEGPLGTAGPTGRPGIVALTEKAKQRFLDKWAKQEGQQKATRARKTGKQGNVEKSTEA